MPVILFIPIQSHIYAEYTTGNSGKDWARIRDMQISSQLNTETALTILCDKIGIELISLTPVFKQSAKNNRMLYYPFDTHWNSEGREVGADYLAQVLQHSLKP